MDEGEGSALGGYGDKVGMGSLVHSTQFQREFKTIIKLK